MLPVESFLGAESFLVAKRYVGFRELSCLSRAFLPLRGMLPVEGFLVAKSFLVAERYVVCREVCCPSRGTLGVAS
jgi:hypothetical protein